MVSAPYRLAEITAVIKKIGSALRAEERAMLVIGWL